MAAISASKWFKKPSNPRSVLQPSRFRAKSARALELHKMLAYYSITKGFTYFDARVISARLSLSPVISAAACLRLIDFTSFVASRPLFCIASAIPWLTWSHVCSPLSTKNTASGPEGSHVFCSITARKRRP